MTHGRTGRRGGRPAPRTAPPHAAASRSRQRVEPARPEQRRQPQRQGRGCGCHCRCQHRRQPRTSRERLGQRRGQHHPRDSRRCSRNEVARRRPQRPQWQAGPPRARPAGAAVRAAFSPAPAPESAGRPPWSSGQAAHRRRSSVRRLARQRAAPAAHSPARTYAEQGAQVLRGLLRSCQHIRLPPQRRQQLAHRVGTLSGIRECDGCTRAHGRGRGGGGGAPARRWQQWRRAAGTAVSQPAPMLRHCRCVCGGGGGSRRSERNEVSRYGRHDVATVRHARCLVCLARAASTYGRVQQWRIRRQLFRWRSQLRGSE